MDATIPPASFKDQSLGQQLGDSLFDVSDHIVNALFQQPPFRNTFGRILSIWMGAQIVQYPERNRTQLRAWRRFHFVCVWFDIGEQAPCPSFATGPQGDRWGSERRL